MMASEAGKGVRPAPTSQQYRDNWDTIFGEPDQEALDASKKYCDAMVDLIAYEEGVRDGYRAAMDMVGTSAGTGHAVVIGVLNAMSEEFESGDLWPNLHQRQCELRPELVDAAGRVMIELSENMQDIPSEFVDTVNEDFWDLVGTEEE